MTSQPRIKIKNIFRHLHTIRTHRKWVRYYCRMLGMNWQGWTHDLSKSSPAEFWESVRWYQGTSSPIDACRKVNGYSRAWMHHRGRNLHHHVAWWENMDKGVKPLRMPEKYVFEMICDWMGAGKAYMGKDFTYAKEYEWYINRQMFLHPQTKHLIDDIMKFILRFGDDGFNYNLWMDMAEEIYVEEKF